MAITTAEAQAQACGLTGYLALLCEAQTSVHITNTITYVQGQITTLLDFSDFDQVLSAYISGISGMASASASGAASLFYTSKDPSGLFYYQYLYKYGIQAYFQNLPQGSSIASSDTIFACLTFILSTNAHYTPLSMLLTNFFNGNQGASMDPLSFLRQYIIAYYQTLDRTDQQPAYLASIWVSTGLDPYSKFVQYFLKYYQTPGSFPVPDSTTDYFTFQP